MNGIRGTTLFVIFGLVLFTNTASATNESNVWCDKLEDPQHPLAWSRLGNELNGLLNARHFLEAYDFIRQHYDETITELSNSENLNQQQKGQSKAFHHLLMKFAAGNLKRTMFRFVPTGQFNDRNVLKLDSGSNHLEFDCTVDVRTFTDRKPVIAAIGYAARLMYVSSAVEWKDNAKMAADRITELADAYRAMLENGLPMWPWELWVNGLGINHNDLRKPPILRQWIFLRPSAGLELRWPSRDEAQAEAAVALEPAGFIKYKTNQYKKWWGLSFLITLGGAKGGAGYGGMMRYNNYSIGISRRNEPNDTFIYLNLDLYKYLRDVKTRSDEANTFLETVRKKLSVPASP